METSQSTSASAGSRVTRFPNNVHKKYNTYEEALEGWKQYCLSHHRHSDDFISGSIYQPLPSAIPRSSALPPSQHNVVVVPSPRKHGAKIVASSPSPLSTPTPAKKSTVNPKTPVKPKDARLLKNKASPSKISSASSSISSPSSITSSSVANFLRYQPSTSAASISAPPRRRLWAVHTKDFNSVVYAEQADRILKEGMRTGESVLVQEVSGVVDAEQWLDSLELQ
ncbi:hypothetical protein C8R42DRAFT_715400 [Lentinula raphanica]|nr:hypothetical protein C8R42DRAFT_715400 [Lentinula raphanica]